MERDNEHQQAPWPKLDERLLRSDLPDWKNNAVLNWRSEHTWGYTEGYRLAVQLLASAVVESGRNQDKLVYPIVFLARHAVEISMKRIVELEPQRPTTTAPRASHDLLAIWKECKAVLLDYSPDSAEVWAVERQVEELHSIDPKSVAFRYDKNLDGSQAIPAEFTHLNLRHFAAVVEKLLSFLEVAHLAISQGMPKPLQD